MLFGLLQSKNLKLPQKNTKPKRTCLSSLLLILTSVPKTEIGPTKLRAMAANLQKQYTEVNRILSQLNDSTENKNCEKYSCESVKCVRNSKGGHGTDRVKQSYAKTQRNTAKRRKRSKKPCNNMLSFQKNLWAKIHKKGCQIRKWLTLNSNLS